MYSYPVCYDRAEADRLIANVTKAINGEYGAIACYEQLAKLAPNDAAKSRILEIRQDEIRHYRTFAHLYFMLTGSMPHPQIVEPCAGEYRSGTEASLMDEQQTVDFYHEIADQVKDPYVKEQFRRAAADEQNHAVWFLYLFTKSALPQSD